MAYADDILISNIQRVLTEGVSDIEYSVRPHWTDGEPANTIYVNSVYNVYDIYNDGIPITTLRPVAWKTALKELLWIYQDKSNDVNLLKDKYGVKYWDSWKNEAGNLGTAYGYQIAKDIEFPEGNFNQIQRVIHLLKTDPMNRRIMTNMINMEEMKDMTLVPCAFMTMWSVRGTQLDMTLIQRSNDLVAAQSINVVQYAFLLYMVAQVTGYQPGKLTHFIQNMHIYTRHLPIVREMLERTPHPEPLFCLKPNVENFEDFRPEHFEIFFYSPHPQIGNIEIAI